MCWSTVLPSPAPSAGSQTQGENHWEVRAFPGREFPARVSAWPSASVQNASHNLRQTPSIPAREAGCSSLTHPERSEMLTLHRVSCSWPAPDLPPAQFGCARLSLLPAPTSEPFQAELQAGRS